MNHKYFFWLCIANLYFVAWQPIIGRQANQLDLPKYGEDKSLVYRELGDAGGDLRLYFFDPRSLDLKKPRAAIVFFFGGGWVGGSPGQFRFHADYLRERGMVAVLADYRTRKSHGASPKECVADAKLAIRFLRANAAMLGVDPDRIVAAGGSAGGHVAAATATLTIEEDRADQAFSCVPNALVLFNPVFNNGPGEWGHKTVKEYWQQISPAHNIREGIPPAIVFLGDKDKLISVKTAEQFQNQMKEVGIQSELHIYPEKGHGFFNFGRDQNASFKDTVEKTEQFLQSLGFLKEGKSRIESFLKQMDSKTSE